MSDPTSNKTMPVIAGIIVLLAIVGGAAVYFTKDKADTPAASQTAAQTPGTDQAEEPEAAENAGKTADPAPTPEEEDEANKAVAADGTEIKKGNPVVAKVDGQEITRVDVYRYIKMMPENVRQLPASAVYPLAMDQVINTRLVQNKAEDAGLENDPEVQAQLSMAKQQIVRSVYVQREVDRQISEADLRKKYDDAVGKVPSIKEIKASHILVSSEDKAKELIAELDKGADFAKLAAQNSADPGNKDKGGDLGWFSKQDMVPEFSDAAFKLGKGEISQTPIKTQFGWHVVKVEDSRDRPKPTFEELKPMIQAEVRREKLEKMLDGWKSAAKIEKFDINGEPLKEGQDVAPAAGNAEPTPAPSPEASAPAKTGEREVAPDAAEPAKAE